MTLSATSSASQILTSSTNIITADDITALNSAWSEEYEDAYIYLHEFTEV